ncbi:MULTISPECIES: glycosyltransferase family 2 protein [Haloarcula]|uniref:glycosyltransferase family 2 protein n=1 Tax=Haloarcula TaxID=2237 RepID=UPI0023EAF15E|nr:glycosyltransferase family 2 protein [Halomicroarcula sp. XH51]
MNKQRQTEKVDVDGLPAVGIVATAGNAEALANTVLRARRHELDVLVFQRCPSTCESVKLANQLDVPIVVGENPRERLLKAALADGAAGLLFVENPRQAVDFEQGITAFRKSDNIIVTELGTLSTLDVIAAVPAYNEEETIGRVVHEALKHVDAVLVVDDGSSDATAKEAAEAGAYTVSHVRNRGYGAALQTIFDRANEWEVEELVVLDGDGQHNAADIPSAVTYRREIEKDIVIGSRFVDRTQNEIPRARRAGIEVINLFTNLMLTLAGTGQWISDTQSGFRVYNRAAVAALSESCRLGDGMESSIDVLFVCHRAGLTVGEIGVDVNYEVSDPNTYHPISHGWSVIRNLIRVVETEHPITLLGIPGLLILLLGFVFGYWTALNYLSTAVFPLGLAITATLFTLAGIFTLFTAIILHALQEHYRTVQR